PGRPLAERAEHRGPHSHRELAHQLVDDPTHQRAQPGQLPLAEAALQRQHLLEQLDRRRDLPWIELEQRPQPALLRRLPRYLLVDALAEQRLDLVAPRAHRRKRIVGAAAGTELGARALAVAVTVQLAERAGRPRRARLQLVALVAEDHPPAIADGDL